MAHLLELETLEVVDQTPDSPALDPHFHVILLNDDHHSDAYVVDMLGKLFCISPEQAFRHALEVDSTGRSIIITCEKPQAEFARDQIHAFGRDPRVQHCAGSMSAVIEPAK
jgi:ATP-dependent Clp protease adaptor protein ClpS